MVIKWINKYSKECGYILNIDYKNRHFNNTYSYEEAKKFKSLENALLVIDKLSEYGENIQNDFEVID